MGLLDGDYAGAPDTGLLGLPIRVIGGLLGGAAQRRADTMAQHQAAMTAAHNAPTLAAGVQAMGQDPFLQFGGSMMGSIKAYHGSPHDFDRFDMSKIGTGEGAQAYGHGLYFAGNEGVAKAYRDALTPGAGTTPKDVAARFLKDAGGNADAARAALQPQMERAMNAGDLEGYDALRAAYGQLFAPENLSGRMYEVNINAEPHQFLDYDKPLSQQSPQVRAALPDMKPDATGAQIYESSRLVPGDYRDPVAATQALRERGIPGIQYLDAGSRGAGEGSRNYVLFNPDLIDILRKYGLAGATVGGGLLGGQPDR